MSFDTSWNVDAYMSEHEPKHHWNLRREFMLAHKKKFPEERLVCLGQTFANMEFMGCRYPEETMRQVAELSAGIVDKYRESKKGKLQRTFISGSDAAGARMNRKPGQKRMTDMSETPTAARKELNLKNSQSSAQKTQSVSSSNNNKSLGPEVIYGPPYVQKAYNSSNCGSSTHHYEDSYQHKGYGKRNTFGLGYNSYLGSSQQGFCRGAGLGFYDPSQESAAEGREIRKQKQQQNISTVLPNLCNSFKPSNSLKDFVIIEKASVQDEPCGVLARSAAMCKVNLQWDFVQHVHGYKCEIKIENIHVASAVAQQKSHARKMAAQNALESLRKNCYVIKVKNEYLSDGSVIGLSRIDSGQEINPLEQNSIGNKLLKMMGWTGGGLGKDGVGIAEPIKPVSVLGRSGLGSGGEERVVSFKWKAKQMIQDFAASNSAHDLVFSSEFTSDERKLMHNMAHRLGLKSKSYSKGDNRFLVISRKFCLRNVVCDLIAQGGSSEKYELVQPEVQ